MKIYFAGPLFNSGVREFIEQTAAKMKELGIEAWVPHMNPSAPPVPAEKVFNKDMTGIEQAEAVVAILDGPMVDDGTACEIGIFWDKMKHEPWRKGIVGWLMDSRTADIGEASEGHYVNYFLQGCIESSGKIVKTFDEVIAALHELEGGTK
jgi:nucleoside 2-deoxyribosyltransferase